MSTLLCSREGAAVSPTPLILMLTCLHSYVYRHQTAAAPTPAEKLAIKCTSPPCNVDNTMTVETGSRVLLGCETSSSQPLSQTVFWFHESVDGVVNQTDCSATIRAHCSISGRFSQDFTLRNISSSNQGKYWCCYSNCESKSDALSVTVANAPSQLPGKVTVTPKVLSSGSLTEFSTRSPTTASIGSTSVHPVVTSSTAAHASTRQASETATQAQIIPDNTRQPAIATPHVESNPRPTLQPEPNDNFSSNDGSGNTFSAAVIAGLCIGAVVVVLLVIVLIIMAVSCGQDRSTGNDSGTQLAQSSSSSDSTDGANNRQPQPQPQQPGIPEQLVKMEKRIVDRIGEGFEDLQDSGDQRESDV